MRIHIIIDARLIFPGVTAVQTAYVLVYDSFPTHGECQKKCVQSWVIEPFPNEFPGGKEDRSPGPFEGLQRLDGTLLSHSSNQNCTRVNVRPYPVF